MEGSLTTVLRSVQLSQKSVGRERQCDDDPGNVMDVETRIRPKGLFLLLGDESEVVR